MKTPISKCLTVLAFTVAIAMPAVAHTAVTQTNITNESHLAAPPKTFDLTLEHAASLASVKLTNGAGEAVKLDYKPTAERKTDFQVPLPALGNGSYKIEWKTIAADGHVMEGAVSFMVMQH